MVEICYIFCLSIFLRRNFFTPFLLVLVFFFPFISFLIVNHIQSCFFFSLLLYLLCLFILIYFLLSFIS